MGDNTFNIKKIETFINQPTYTNNAELEKKIEEVTNNFNEKLDVIISKQDEAKINQEKVMEETLNEVQIWLNEIMSATGNAFELLDENEQRRFEDLKGMIEKANTKEDWDSTLTLVFPLLDKIGIKLESKTKIKDLNDLKEKLKGLIWKKNKSKEIDDNDPNKQLDE